jgi:hypothetical protein
VIRFEQVDISKNTNSFHHLQLLCDNHHNYLFERWGRVGCEHFDVFFAKCYPDLTSGSPIFMGALWFVALTFFFLSNNIVRRTVCSQNG